MTHSEVVNMSYKNKEYTIETNNQTVIAKRVVNAAGVWAPFIGEMLGIDIPITPRIGHILVGSRQESVMLRNVMVFGYLLNQLGYVRITNISSSKYNFDFVI